MEAGEVADAVSDAKFRIPNFLGVGMPEITDSASWFRESFERCGGWDSWVWETVNGKDFNTRLPVFDGFVVPSWDLGRANAMLVELALKHNRAVLFVRDGHAVGLVRKVITEDANNWKGGYSVVVDEIGA